MVVTQNPTHNCHKVLCWLTPPWSSGLQKTSAAAGQTGPRSWCNEQRRRAVQTFSQFHTNPRDVFTLRIRSIKERSTFERLKGNGALGQKQVHVLWRHTDVSWMCHLLDGWLRNSLANNEPQNKVQTCIFSTWLLCVWTWRGFGVPLTEYIHRCSKPQADTTADPHATRHVPG